MQRYLGITRFELIQASQQLIDFQMNRFIRHNDKKGILKNRIASKNARDMGSRKDGSDGELELPEIKQAHGLERAESSKLSLHANKNGFIK